jgi:hypothetical protein
MGDTWLALTNPTGLYLLAFDASRIDGNPWSNANLQPALNGFTHPETYRAVSLACRDVHLSSEFLLVTACENRRDSEDDRASENRSDGNGDVWLLYRTLDETPTWFPTPTPAPPWNAPEVLAESDRAFTNPALVSDPPGRLHAFWSDSGESSVFYALWDGERWSQATALFNSPGGKPQDVSALLHPSGELYLAWSDPEAGEVYTSHASSSRALAPDAWSPPLPVATAGMTANSGTIFNDPQLALAADGTLLLAYAIPYNEGRGIYIQRSLPPTSTEEPLGAAWAEGAAWSQPELVFDAATAGWASLDEPRLAILPDGRLEMLWTRRDIPPELQSLGLYSSQSSGQAAAGSPNVTSGWTEAVEVLRGETLWSDLLVDANGRLNRAWQQVTVGQPVLLHQVSSDGGVTWSEAARITGLENTEGPASIAAGAGGSLYLAQIEPASGQNETGSAALSTGAVWELRLWQWHGSGSWQAVESQAISGVQQPSALALAFSGDGKLVVLFPGLMVQPVPETEIQPGAAVETFAIQAMARSSVIDSDQDSQLPASPSESSEGTNMEATAAPSTDRNLGAENESPATTQAPGLASPTVAVPLSSQPPGLVQKVLGSSYSGLVIGLLPAALLVLALVIVVTRRRK